MDEYTYVHLDISDLHPSLYSFTIMAEAHAAYLEWLVGP